jgi:transcriptional regulator with XRE-family HTH domain
MAKVCIGAGQRPSFRDAFLDMQAIQSIDRHVGQQLRIIRIRANLSRTELGHKVDLSCQQIRKYENGKNHTSASVLYEVANCLNVPILGFFDSLTEAGSAQSNDGFPETDERIRLPRNERRLRLCRRDSATSVEAQNPRACGDRGLGWR